LSYACLYVLCVFVAGLSVFPQYGAFNYQNAAGVSSGFLILFKKTLQIAGFRGQRLQFVKVSVRNYWTFLTGDGRPVNRLPP
jgi:hypothetical protein